MKAELAVKEGIQGRYCRLELLDVEKHCEKLFKAFEKDDGRMWTYLRYGPYETQAKLSEKLLDMLKGDIVAYVVVVEDIPLGYLTYLNINDAVGSVEIGSVIFSPLLQKTRASTEAKCLLIEHCFNVGFRRCEWKCDELNAKSFRAAERLGFTYEGTFRQAMVVKRRNRNSAYFSIIDREYSSVKTKHDMWLDPNNFDESNQQKKRMEEF